MTDPQQASPRTITHQRFTELAESLVARSRAGERIRLDLDPYSALWVLCSIELANNLSLVALMAQSMILRPIVDRTAGCLIGGFSDPSDADDMTALIAMVRDGAIPLADPVEPEAGTSC